MHEKEKKKKKKKKTPALAVSACDVSSISEYLLQRMVMMWHVLFILRNIQFPLAMVKGKECVLYNVLTDDILFVLRNIRTVQRGYNSVERKVS